MEVVSEVVTCSYCLQKWKMPPDKTDCWSSLCEQHFVRQTYFWTMAMWRTQLSPVTAKAVWDLWASQTLNCHVSPVFWLPWTACLWVILSFRLELHRRYNQFADQDLKLFPDGVNSLHLPKNTVFSAIFMGNILPSIDHFPPCTQCTPSSLLGC